MRERDEFIKGLLISLKFFENIYVKKKRLANRRIKIDACNIMNIKKNGAFFFQ